MQWQLKELLEHARKHPVKLLHIQEGAFKECVASRDFEDGGKMYLVNRERGQAPEVFSLSEGEARRLGAQGKINIVKGGSCDTRAVQVGPGTRLFAFLPWEEPAPAGTGGGGEYDKVLLRCRLRKYVNVIPGINLTPGDEFYVPYKLINQIGFSLEDDSTWYPGPLILLINQEPYEPPDAKATA